MAKKTNMLAGLSNAKTRTFVIVFGAVIIIGIIIAVTRGKDSNEDVLSKQASQTVAVPSSIKATPGNAVPEKYRELQMQENERRAQQALQTKSSAIPTIIGAISDTADKDKIDLTALNNTFKTQGPEGQAKLQLGQAEGDFSFGKSARDKAKEDQDARLKEQRDRVDKAREDKSRADELERLRRLKEGQLKEWQDAVQRIEGQMKNYAQVAYVEWTKLPTQVYVAGQLADKQFKRSTPDIINSNGDVISGTGAATPTRAAKTKVFIKAGTIFYGVLDTAINSDEPGPVLATVVSGKYAGAKMVGALTHQPQQEAVIVTFTQMSVPKRLKSFSVQAVAIDTDTARTALATGVDKHILFRYGTLFASNFVSGYGKAITNSGTTTVSPLTGTTTTSTPPLDNKQIVLAAIGQVGTQWAQATQQYFNTPYTVTVDKGTGVGLLFLGDVEVTDEI